MRTPSTSENELRRNPQQARAAARRARFLEVAAGLFGELGYDAVTMTAIAEQAQGSIGTLYDYFPDKQAIALALLDRYASELDTYWDQLLKAGVNEKDVDLAELFVNGVLDFVRERPAYLSLHSAPIAFNRSKAAREPLRKAIASALQTLRPGLAADRAFLGAQVVVELIKGLVSVYKHAPEKDKKEVTEQFKRLVAFYLNETLE